MELQQIIESFIDKASEGSLTLQVFRQMIIEKTRRILSGSLVLKFGQARRFLMWKLILLRLMGKKLMYLKSIIVPLRHIIY